MAIVNGTNGNDFIHRAGDGRTGPANYTDITGVTTGDDQIDGGDSTDIIYGDAGDDTITGGGGNDVIFGEAGNDSAFINTATGGASRINLGAGRDNVSVAGAAGEVRLTFTSSEVGNGSANDSNTQANQDGGLAVRLQAEDGADGLTGPVVRVDDEGTTFTAAVGVTFDVRDLVSGAQRGNFFQVVTLGTSNADIFTAAGGLPTYINAGQGDDTLTGDAGNDFLVGGAGDDSLDGGAGDDSFIGGGGADTIQGGGGNDAAIYNVSTDGADAVNLGGGSDLITVNANAPTNVRLTFTSAEVGNGSFVDGGALPNQDGGLAVRLQGEDGSGVPTGPTTRTDDEGVTYVGGAGVTFDVRDLVSGAARGELFEVVRLGTEEGETLDSVQAARPYYINAGLGDDTVNGGDANDFLVGGGGNDALTGGLGNDSFIGGGGNDQVLGGAGNDTAIYNISTDGSDAVNLGDGSDIVTVNASAPTNVRLTFTSAEVGNGSASDSNTLANQDGGLAVRLQAEDGSNTPAGSLGRLDDEGVTFVGGAGVTFDVRDLVSGAARGEQFEVVTLGTAAAETLNSVQANRNYYINAGQGDDTVNGGLANDFLVGGAGDDRLVGSAGNDSFIGGGGNDQILGGTGVDTAIFNVTTDGRDAVNLGTGPDVVNVNAGSATNVRLTFTSAEIGNGQTADSGALANQDGGLAVRLQAETGGALVGSGVSRFDDEGVTFVGGAGVTFDVRDLVSGAARGEQFEVVTLGTNAGETLDSVQAARPYYINAGQGDDIVNGGNANDFLVGGAGDDDLNGGLGDDSFIGGAGNDTIRGSLGNDTAIFNVTTDGADIVNLDQGSDVVTVNANAATNVRLTFTSSEVGNGDALDSGSLANQDGGLAVRLQAEDGSDVLTGPTTRTDDEGITYVGGAGVTFDVRDLPSGTARGDLFEVVTLGTSNAETLTAVQGARPYYINAGQGNDIVRGGTANDFLVGGGGNDVLVGATGNDTFIGGGGRDSFTFSSTLIAGNADAILDFAVVDDIVRLDNSVFLGLSEGILSSDAFVIGSAAADADDRVIYDSAAGALLFDRDGSGTDFDAVQFSTITAGLGLTSNDFVVV